MELSEKNKDGNKVNSACPEITVSFSECSGERQEVVDDKDQQEASRDDHTGGGDVVNDRVEFLRKAANQG